MPSPRCITGEPHLDAGLGLRAGPAASAHAPWAGKSDEPASERASRPATREHPDAHNPRMLPAHWQASDSKSAGAPNCHRAWQCTRMARDAAHSPRGTALA